MPLDCILPVFFTGGFRFLISALVVSGRITPGITGPQLRAADEIVGSTEECDRRGCGSGGCQSYPCQLKLYGLKEYRKTHTYP